MPDETVIYDKIVALDSEGRSSLKYASYGSAKASVSYYVFDLMGLAGKDVMAPADHLIRVGSHRPMSD